MSFEFCSRRDPPFLPPALHSSANRHQSVPRPLAPTRSLLVNRRNGRCGVVLEGRRAEGARDPPDRHFAAAAFKIDDLDGAPRVCCTPICCAHCAGIRKRQWQEKGRFGENLGEQTKDWRREHGRHGRHWNWQDGKVEQQRPETSGRRLY